VVTTRLFGKGCRLESLEEGLNESTRVQALFQCSASELGVRPKRICAALFFGSRMLRDTETLAETSVTPFGSVVDVWVGEGGGMPTGLDGQQTIEDLSLQVLDLEAQLGAKVTILQERIRALSPLEVFGASGTPAPVDCSANERSALDSVESRMYVQAVITGLKKGKDLKDSDARKETEKQITALQSIAKVMEMRLRPAGGPDAELVFDTGLDDDETLLGLMSEIDRGEQRDGAVSKEELFASKFLKEGQNKDISRVFRTTFESDLSALENALAHLEESDFADYRRPLKVDGMIGIDKLSVFDRKASVQAVFDAAVEVMTLKSGQIPTEDVITVTIKGADRDSLEQLADICKSGSENLSLALKGLANTLLEDNSKLDFTAVKRAACRVPRVAGQRMEWVGSMGLNAMLARHLPPGTLTDGLAGVRHMSAKEAKLALAAFFEDAGALFLKTLHELRLATGSKSAVEANGKFQGFEGSFASLKDFHAGAEETLKLGYPNPDIMRGILLEHTAHSSATRLFATTNYCIATSLLIEYWWATFESSPTDAAVRKKACEQLRKIRSDRSDTEPMEVAALVDEAHPLFPGEVKDSFTQTLLVVTATAADHCFLSREALVEEADRAAGIKPVNTEASKRLVAAAREVAGSVLSTDEEWARGVTVMQRPDCLKWMAASSSILQTRPPAAKPPFELELKHGAALVGLVLPMSADRAERFIHAISNGVKRGLDLFQQQQLVIGAHIAARKTVVFGSYAGVDALRNELGTLSLDELKARAYDLSVDAAPQAGSAAETERAQLCEIIAASFVRTDLRADLETALSNARDCDLGGLVSKVEELVRAWGPAPAEASPSPEDWMKLAAERLDSEERWSEVEGWVRLYCGRFQGRTRVGLKALMERKAEDIRLYNLRDGEVLALYIYTGSSLELKGK
jgi:hypothetical protein